MHIEHAVVVAARGGHFNEDLQAIRAGARRDGYLYLGDPQAPGFDAIRQPSEAFSLVLRLEGGATVAGDGMSVAYSAAGGRCGLFRAAEQLPHLQAICDHLRGRTVGDLAEMCADLEAQPYDERLHRNAAFYGASQALAQAVAIAKAARPRRCWPTTSAGRWAPRRCRSTCSAGRSGMPGSTRRS